jgi:hypothetical protein
MGTPDVIDVGGRRVLIFQRRSLAEVEAERAERAAQPHRQPGTLTRVDAERLSQLRAIQARTMAATDAARGQTASPPHAPAPPPTATAPKHAPRSTRTATSGRRSSRARQVAPPTTKPAPPPPPKPAAAPALPLRFFDPTDPEPDWSAPFKRGFDAWMEEKALKKEGRG